MLALLNQIQAVISMGNTATDNHADSLMKVIEKQYEQIRQDTRGIVLLNKKSQNTYLLKQYTYGSEALFKKKEKQLQDEIKQGPRENIVSPIKVECRVFNSFCSTSYKIYAIFEYPQVTLKEEILARQKENKNFEQAELWSILQSCTNALSELKPLVSLNTNEIFINPDGNIKIIHDDLIDQNYRAVLNDQIYYAPEKLKNFNKLDSDLTLRKESIFSMGMTILEAAQLYDAYNCYNFNDGVFMETAMIDLLEYLSERYSPEFMEIMSNILEPNPNRRASLMEVQKNLDNFWNAEQLQQSMEHQAEQSKGNTEMAELSETSHLNQNPLTERSMNQQNMDLKPSAKKYLQANERGVAMPQKLPCYKLEEQSVARPEEIIPQTPKNPPTVNENTLFTDPKLLQMIKKDLEDINKLKHSAFYETSKYTFMYPQTQSILNSIKNFETEPKAPTRTIEQFNKVTLGQSRSVEQASKRISQLAPSTMMMKKKQNDLIFTVQSYEDGRRYEGTTLNGKKHGQGKLMFEDGAYYQGQFKEDKMNGKGVLYYNQNFPAYDGQWSNDQFHGYGILYNQYPQQLTCEYDFHEMSEVQDYWVKYEGQFYLDNKHGNGILSLTNGQVFEGEFSEDSINGRGRYTCMSGEIIEGEWSNNTLVNITQQ